MIVVFESEMIDSFS